MSLPSCPKCRSDFVVPDTTSNGGAGRNVCMNCGHRAQVVDFHQSLPDPYGRIGSNAFAHVFPEGYRNLRPAKSHELFHNETPAAPIRQYKDD